MSMMDVQLNCQDKVPVSESLQNMVNEQAAFGVKAKIDDSKTVNEGNAKISKALLIGVIPLILAVVLSLYFIFR